MRLVQAMILGGLVVAGSGVSVARAQSSDACRMDKVQQTTGSIMTMSTGTKYQPYPGQGQSTVSWLPLDKVQICRVGGNAYEITNLSRKSRAVKALYVTN